MLWHTDGGWFAPDHYWGNLDWLTYLYNKVHAQYTIHDTPYTMHHALCTMHYAPCTIHHAPCTMHHTPYISHHTPYISHHTSHTLYYPPYRAPSHREWFPAIVLASNAAPREMVSAPVHTQEHCAHNSTLRSQQHTNTLCSQQHTALTTSPSMHHYCIPSPQVNVGSMETLLVAVIEPPQAGSSPTTTRTR
jgi:hypothetical protein